MLIEKLSLTFKCHSAIGNSLDLNEMIHEVLRVFVSETFAVYGAFAQKDDTDKLIVTKHFGRMKDFDINLYDAYTKNFNLIEEEESTAILIRLNNGSLCLVFKNKEIDFPFYISMFESLVTKLNMSIDSCLNVQHIKEKNKLLEEQKKALQAANKAKDDFLANMSHELKTPLNSINVISAVMMKNKKGKLDSEQVKNLEIINSCGNDLLFLINNVLDLSKLEAGEIKLQKEALDIKRSMRNLIDMFEPQVYTKHLTFEYEIDESIGLIFSDEQRIKQIVKNLLSNALKFVHQGSIRLTINNLEDAIEIIVSDDGIGIAKDKLEHIFNRFRQADESTTRKYGGTGLGLAISKELVQLLGGELSIESQVGVGTTVRFLVPKNEEELQQTDEILDLLDIRTPNEKGSILVFNSDPLLFLQLIIELKKEYDVLQTSNVEEFLLFIEKNPEISIIADSSKKSVVKMLCSVKNNIKKQQLILIEDDNSDIEALKKQTLQTISKPIDIAKVLQSLSK